MHLGGVTSSIYLRARFSRAFSTCCGHRNCVFASLDLKTSHSELFFFLGAEAKWLVIFLSVQTVRIIFARELLASNAQILFLQRVKSLLPFLFSAWGYLHPRWTSWCTNWQCLLGALLSGAWHTARRADALRQNHRRRRRLLQHLLQRDGRRETRSPCRVCRPGAYCCG